MVDQKTQLLPYARPMTAAPRPPMYRLVVTILVASGVIFFGMVGAITFLMMLFEPHQRLLSVIPLAVAAWLLFAGYRSMSIAVGFLRGVPPRQHWERWIFSL
jgi:hypothetical protein